MERRKLKFISSFDDGNEMDMRLAEILKEFGLPGIFFMPNCHQISCENLVSLSKDFEIGGHTVSHFTNPKDLPDDVLRTEIVENKKYLEDLISKKITKFCYPRGRYDQRYIDLVREAGYESARTTMVLKTKSEDPFKTDTTVHVFAREEYGAFKWFEVAKLQAIKASEEGGYFHLWGHAKELERNKEWDNLRMFFKWLTDNFEVIKA